MVAIGNYNLNMPHLSSFSGILTFLLGSSLVLVVVGGIIAYIVVKVKDKAFYKYPVTLLFMRQDGGVKENPFLRGGLTQNKQGAKDFKVKTGKWFWQTKAIGYVPDGNLMDMDDRVTFLTTGDGTLWQQVKKSLITRRITKNKDKEDEVTNLIMEPIPTDVKTITVQAIRDVENALDKRKLTAYGISVIAFVIMAVVQIAFFYFARKHG